MRSLLLAIMTLSVFSLPLRATWSIVLADRATGEVGVGTVTCLTNFDLLAIVPVVVVEKGAAAVQASGDFAGTRRPIIFEAFQNQTSPQEILASLATVPGHESRQYGIVNTNGEAVTFSGNQTLSWSGGITGNIGDLDYALQGNILVGPCVASDIEAAIRDTPGDMPEKLMAGMQAARMAGGDGRCSCAGPNPEGCGCPVVSFAKSGHIGGMIVARPGDIDDSVCNQDGCADGSYYMRLNVPFQQPGNPDPVDQLQDQFNAFRSGLLGRMDAGTSTVTFVPNQVPPNGTSEFTLRVTLRDHQNQPVTLQPISAELSFLNGNGNGTQILPGAAILPGGIVEFQIIAGDAGLPEIFRVSVTDPSGTIQLMPNPVLAYPRLGDLNGDGAIRVDDLVALIREFGPCPAEAPCLGDLNGDGAVDAQDSANQFPLWN